MTGTQKKAIAGALATVAAVAIVNRSLVSPDPLADLYPPVPELMGGGGGIYEKASIVGTFTVAENGTPGPLELDEPFITSVATADYPVDVFIEGRTRMVCGRYLNPDTNVYSKITYGGATDPNAIYFLTARKVNASITNWTISP